MNRLFIVAPNDAEGVAIINMLNKHKEEYVTTAQKWGARWDKISKEDMDHISQIIDEDTIIYGIELQGSINNCINIDHHKYENDDRSNSRSALEQVANIIGVVLTREERLIALNDTGYIPAMEEAGATDEEIKNIRAIDRKAQGITATEEGQAIKALKSMYPAYCRALDKDISIIESPHSIGACYTDRLYNTPEGESILVMSADGEANFYGPKQVVSSLHNMFGGWIGGGDNIGFWGNSKVDLIRIRKFLAIE